MLKYQINSFRIEGIVKDKQVVTISSEKQVLNLYIIHEKKKFNKIIQDIIIASSYSDIDNIQSKIEIGNKVLIIGKIQGSKVDNFDSSRSQNNINRLIIQKIFKCIE